MFKRQKKYLTKAERAEFTLTKNQKEMVVGLLLGDLNAQNLGVNARLRFAQGTVHKDYLNWLYEQFQDLCPQDPKILIQKPHIRTGKVYSSIWFNTNSLPCFNELYNLFYLDGRKVVPMNIGDLLTPLGLAYWIADDGCFD